MARHTPRSVRYVLNDPLLKFWFRFVFPNMSYIFQSTGQKAFSERVSPHLDSYLGGCFEGLCRYSLSALYRSQGITAAYQTGEYWSKQTQIDVVGLRQDNWTDLGECKWGAVRSVKEVEASLDTKVGLYPNQRNATIGRHIFAKALPKRLAPADTPIQWHSLEQMYGW